MRYIPSLPLLISVCVASCSYCSYSLGETITASFESAATSRFIATAGQAIDPPAPDPFDNRKAQTFLANVTGTVSKVSFTAEQRAGTTAPLRVDISSVAAGLPTASLAHAIVPTNEIPTPTVPLPQGLNIHADFSATDLLLVAGTRYAIIFSSEASNANYGLYGTRSIPTYAEGAHFFSQNDSPWAEGSSGDLFFEVTVTPVPEPSSIVMLALGCGLALLAYHPRRRRFFTAR